jgi:hypothetical protein
MAGTKANTPEETEAALEELGPDCIRIYTDGGSRTSMATRRAGARTRCECTRTTGRRYWWTSRAPS